VRLTDTTFRDGHRLLDLPADELVPVAAKLDSIGFFSLDAFGGRSFDASLRRGLDPWAWLRRLAAATPATPLQALISGRTLLGDRTVADDVVELFVATAAAAGVDVFRVFDPLNDVGNMRVAIRAARRAGKRVQGTLCYAVSPAHDLELWRSLAAALSELEVDDIVLMDTSGLLGPRAAKELVGALGEAVRLPIVVHARCGSGMAPMAYLAAVLAGAGVLDTAMSPLAWGVSEPATETLVAALAGGDHDTGLDLDRLAEVKHDLVELMRGASADGAASPGGLESEVLRHQLPAPMLEDLRRQLEQHNAEARLREALEEVPRVRAELGFPPLVAPVRQIVAAQAVYNVLGGDRYATVSHELKEYLQGLYGVPPRPADAEVRRLVLGQDEPITIRPADLLEPQVEGAVEQLRRRGVEPTDERVLTYVLFPSPALDLFLAPSAPAKPPAAAATSEAPPEAASPNGVGESAPAPQPEAPAAPQAVSAEFDVEVEGEVFRVRVAGAGVAVLPAAAAGAPAAMAPAAGPAPARARDGAVTAPMQGLIVKVPVQVGDEVKLGDVVAVLEAMKMQNDIVATQPGKVVEVYVKEGDVVSPNQPLVAVG
jgi:pyruvate carboxylase subunit B